jgi:beta-lactamase class A
LPGRGTGACGFFGLAFTLTYTIRMVHLIARSCAIALILLAGSASAEGTVADLRDSRDSELQAAMERVVADAGLSGEVAQGRLALALVDATDPAAPRLAMLNGDRMMYAASMPKVAILLGALAEAEAGRLPINSETVAAMTSMIRFSSNADASRVLHWVGVDRLAEILQSSRFALYDRAGAGGLWVGKGYGPEPATRRDPLHNLSHGATAFQVARLYWMLATDRLLSPPMNALMKQILSRPGVHHNFVKALEGRPGVELFRKSGTWKNTHADSALVECRGKRYVLVGIAEHAEGGQWLTRLAGPMHDLIVPPAPLSVSSFSSTGSTARSTREHHFLDSAR